MKKRFGIDIDGTVTRPDTFIPFLNKAFNLKLTYEDVTQYSFLPYVQQEEKEFAKWFLENEPHIYSSSLLSDGAKDVLDKWVKKIDLYFISARRSHLLELTKEWFLSNQLHFDHLELIGSHDKIATAKKYNVDIFFEDKHDNAVTISEECGIPVILFNTPYNQEPVPKSVIRVNNWSEAERWVNNWLKNN
ncbi:hypothetical protein [Peribacillus alkalitolerans]|uniref:hypothetical protein n=1 Tax=Peribacillus alkalitolerans TaxID=1550385 RepID=UPI0013D4757E|nr:hypothetical protein [Peribacillus alkalitolerans]